MMREPSDFFSEPENHVLVAAGVDKAAQGRITLGRMHNPVRGLLHGSATLLSIVALIALVRGAQHPTRVWALGVYGVALVGLYATSTLYHAVPWRPVWKARLQRLDHALIYVLVAGTFTPLLIGVLDGPSEWLGLAMVWSLAAVGTAREFLHVFKRRWSLSLQMVLGAIILFPLYEALSRMSPLAMILTLGGGVVYLVGVSMFVNGWPRLMPRVFSYHELFHVLVVVASVAHFVAVREVIFLSG